MNANCCNCFALPCAASDDDVCAASEDTCLICLEPVTEAPLGQPRYAVTCGGGHFLHDACLESMLISNVEALRARSALVLEAETASTDALATLEGRVRCPMPSCSSGPWPDSLVATHVADEAFQTYLLGRTMLPAARELATALERARRSMGTAEGGEDLQAAADEALTCELLKASFAGRARQCARCFLGPVDLDGCANLASHHGESDGRGRVDNSCPRCGWFADSWEMWPVWDGRSARESGSMRVVDAVEAWRRLPTEGRHYNDHYDDHYDDQHRYDEHDDHDHEDHYNDHCDDHLWHYNDHYENEDGYNHYGCVDLRPQHLRLRLRRLQEYTSSIIRDERRAWEAQAAARLQIWLRALWARRREAEAEAARAARSRDEDEAREAEAGVWAEAREGGPLSDLTSWQRDWTKGRRALGRCRDLSRAQRARAAKLSR